VIGSGLLTVACGIGLLATSGWLITRASERPPVLELSVAIGSVQAFALGRGIARYLQRLAVHDRSLALLGRLRLRLFDDLEPRIPGGVTGGGTGAVLSGFVSDADLVAGGKAKQVTAAVDVSASVCLGTIVAFLIRPDLGVFLLAGMLVVVASAFLLARIGRSAIEDEADLRQVLAGIVVETVRSARELAAYDRVDLLESRLEDVRRRSRTAATKRALVLGIDRAATVILSGAALVLIVSRGIADNRANRISGVLLAVVAFVALAVFDQCAGLPTVLAETGIARAAARRLRDLSATPPATTETEVDHAPEPGEVTAALEHATVRAEGNSLLSDLSLVVAPKRRVALVGPSGSGKSTAIAALLHFTECAEGRATIGGVDVREITRESISTRLGWIADENHVFSATLRENLRLADPSASDAECSAALRRVGLGDLLADFPLGLSTPVGAAGRQLSAGESQRLAMARLLLSPASVLLLDEPAAHLDPETGPRTLADILDASRGHAVLVVSHDTHIGDDVDELVTLSAGRSVTATSPDATHLEDSLGSHTA
jgi:thiol reductant ABC exporter CydC subunit